MAKRKLKTRQRTFLSTRMKIVVGVSCAVFFAASLLVYFNFNQVSDSKAFGSGDYRVVGSGDWNDLEIWEVFDGERWIDAQVPPGEAAGSVVVTAGNSMEITDEIAINNLIIQKDARVSIESNTVKISKWGGKGGIVCEGTLITGISILEGDGDFILGDEAILMIGSDAGIDKKAKSGNIQLSGKKTFSKSARYIFNGSVKQHTGDGLPSVIGYMEVRNKNGIILDQSLQVTEELRLHSGTLTTEKFHLTLGTSTSGICRLLFDEGSFCGNVKYWYGADHSEQLKFRVSDGSVVNELQFEITEMKFRKGMIELNYSEGIPDDSKKSPFAARQVVVAITARGYHSVMLSNGPDEAWLSLIKVTENGDGVPGVFWTIGKKDADNHQPGENGQFNSGIHANRQVFSNILYGPGDIRERLIVRFYSESKARATIHLVNQAGKVVHTENVETGPGYNQVNIVREEILPTGSYMVQLSSMSEIHTFRVVSSGKEKIPGNS